MPTQVNEDARSEESTLFAIGSYEDFLEQTEKKKDPDSLYRQWIAAIKIWDFALAQDKLFQNLVAQQNKVTAWILKSLTLYNKNDPAGALTVLAWVKTTNPTEKSVVQLMQWVYLIENKNFAKAENNLVSAQKIDPTASATPYYLAVAQNGGKKWKASIANAQKAENLGMKGPLHEKILAEGYFWTKQWEEAVTAYEDLIKTGDEEFDTLMRLWDSMSRVWNDQETVDTFARIATKYPNETAPLMRQATLLTTMEQYEQATQVYDQLEKKVDQDDLIDVRITKLSLYHKQWRMQEKEALYNKIAANIGDDVASNLKFAQQLLSVDMAVQAKGYIDTAIVKAPKNQNVRLVYRDYLVRELLQSLRTQRDIDQAAEKLMTIFPWDKVAKNFLVLAYRQINDEGLVTRLSQELGRDPEWDNPALMELFFELYEQQYDQVGATIQELNIETVGIIKISLLQWYVAAVQWNEQAANDLVNSLSFRVPGLNNDLVNDVFEKEFKNWIEKYDSYYTASLIDMLP